MSYTVNSYPSGTFSWADLVSTNISEAKKFYEKLFGWTSQDMPTQEGMPDYTMFFKDDYAVAGGSPAWGDMNNSVWNSYISVDDLDAVVSKATESGAQIIMPATDVLEAGRMATISDPTGAIVSFWQPKNHIGAQLVNTVGAMGWNELYTPDINKAKEFYTNVLNWEYEESGDYAMIKNNDRLNGGMVATDADSTDVPPHWRVYFTVENLADSVNLVNKLNGKIVMPPTKAEGVGEMAYIQDPSGAHLTIIELESEPDHWPQS